MSVSNELLERSVKTLWDSGITEEELMKLFKIKREKVKELLRS